MQTKIDTELKKNGYSATLPRRLVFTALEQAGTLSMQQIEKATSSQIDRASVYRTMRLFEELGFIRRISQGWKYTFELSDLFRHHHHHLVCRICETVVELQDTPGLEESIGLLIKSYGFTGIKHEIEISGVCPRCAL